MDDPFEAYAQALNGAQQANEAAKAGQLSEPDDFVKALMSADGLIKAGKSLKEAVTSQIDLATRGQQSATLVGTAYKINVTREDRETWDQDKIKALYSSTVPDYVKATYSVAKSTLNALPAPEQAALQACRKITSTKLNIDIEAL